MINTLSKTLRRSVLGLSLAFSLAAFAVPAHAADLPKFSDPAVNDFVKRYDDFVNVMIKDMNSNDVAKITADGDKQKDFLADIDKLQGKVKPEEAEAWQKFFMSEVERMQKAAAQ